MERFIVTETKFGNEKRYNILDKEKDRFCFDIGFLTLDTAQSVARELNYPKNSFS